MAAFPPQMPAQGVDVGQAGSQPPGAPPMSDPSQNSPLTALSQKGGSSSSSSGSLLQMILMLLAGMGVSHGMDSLPKMLSALSGKSGPKAGMPMKPGQGGQPQPGQPPQGGQQLPDPAMLLKLLAMRGGPSQQ